MKHKHYGIGVAKLADTSLVKFIKLTNEWIETQSEDWNITSDYFLCLPQHKEACLHWLNGGSLQDFFEGSWTSVDDFEGEDWVEADNMFMNEEYQFKAKPKKEKRWIAYSTNQKRLGCLSFDSEQEVRAHYIHEVDEPQFIEIEVEV